MVLLMREQQMYFLLAVVVADLALSGSVRSVDLVVIRGVAFGSVRSAKTSV